MKITVVKAKTGVEICKIEALPSDTVEEVKKRIMSASKRMSNPSQNQLDAPDAQPREVSPICMLTAERGSTTTRPSESTSPETKSPSTARTSVPSSPTKWYAPSFLYP